MVKEFTPDGDCSVHNLDFDNRYYGNHMYHLTQLSAWPATLNNSPKSLIFPLTMTITCYLARKTSSAQLTSGGKH